MDLRLKFFCHRLESGVTKGMDPCRGKGVFMLKKEIPIRANNEQNSANRD